MACGSSSSRRTRAGPLAESVGSVKLCKSRVEGPEDGLVVQDVVGLTAVVRDNPVTGVVRFDTWNASGGVV